MHMKKVQVHIDNKSHVNENRLSISVSY